MATLLSWFGYAPVTNLKSSAAVSRAARCAEGVSGGFKSGVGQRADGNGAENGVGTRGNHCHQAELAIVLAIDPTGGHGQRQELRHEQSLVFVIGVAVVCYGKSARFNPDILPISRTSPFHRQ